MIEKIQVVIQSLTSKFSQGLNTAAARLKQFGKGLDEFGMVMKAPLDKFREFNKNNQKFATLGGRLANRFRLMTHGLRGFRMEMLGVMFFGMMLQKTFMGLLQPVMDAYGVFDLFRIMLLTLFLPIMEMIFPVLLQIMDWFMNLPEPVQKAIGVMVLIGAAVGTLLFLFGALSLGIGSVIQALPGLGAAVQGIGAIFAGLSAPILAVIAVVVAVIIGMYLAWKENFLGMKNIVSNFIDGIKQWFHGIITIVKGVFNIIKGILTGDFDTFILGIKQLFSGLWDFLVGGFKAAFNLITGIIVGALKILENIVNLLLKVGSAIGNFITGKGFVTEGAPQLNIGGVGRGSAAVTNQGSVNITNNYSGFTQDDLQRQIDQSQKDVVDQVRRATQ